MNYFDQQPGMGEADFSCDEPHTYDGHQGTDFSVYSFRAMDHGTWVTAAAPGLVTATTWDQFDRNYELPYLGSGNFVRVQHDDGSVAFYWHMRENSVAVEVGERVETGQRLGLVGSSGSSPIPHLHFEVWENGIAVDPFDGPCNNRPGAWADQPDYAGDVMFRVLDGGVSDVHIPILTGTYQGHNGMRPLKDTPLDALEVAEDAVLSLWVHFQGRSGATFELQLLDPQGDLAYSRMVTLQQRREYGWRLQKLAVSGLGDLLAHGTWQYRVMFGDEVFYEKRFEIGSQSRYAPRFYPLAGRAIRLGAGDQTVPLEVVGASEGDLRLLPVAMPDGVEIVDGELRIPGSTALNRRIHESIVVATDSSGFSDTFVVHFIDPRATSLDDWERVRPDRLSRALTGSWYRPETSGQGLFFEYFKTQDLLFGGWFAFGLAEQQPPKSADWLVASGNPDRNRVVLDLLRVRGGKLLDPDSPVSFSKFGSVGTLALVINGCETSWAVDFRDRELQFQQPELERIVQDDACVNNDPGRLSQRGALINGNWFDPSMGGQGIMFEYIEHQARVYGNWFTFDPAGNRNWFALIGDYEEPVATLEVLRVATGTLNEPGSSAAEAAGFLEVDWSGECGTASMTYIDPTGARYSSDLVKISPASCSKLLSAPEVN